MKLTSKGEIVGKEHWFTDRQTNESWLKSAQKSASFKEYSGKSNEQMLNLIADGKTPLGVAGIMQQRLNVLYESLSESKSSLDALDAKEYWWKNYFTTGDCIFYHPDGRIKIVLGSKAALDLMPYSLDNTILSGDNAGASISSYEALDGAEFRQSELEKYIGCALTKNEAKSHPVWNALAGGDTALLNEYTDTVFAYTRRNLAVYNGSNNITHNEEIKLRCSNIDVYHLNNNMAVYLAMPKLLPEKTAAWRLWTLGIMSAGSDANGYFPADYPNSRLIGVPQNIRRI